MVDGVVVLGGTAAGTSGATGATDSVMVSPLVTSDVVTGPGGAGSGVWATLTSLNVTVSAPITSTAVAPAVADNTLNCFDFTSDHSIRSLVVSNSSPEVDGLPLHCYGVTKRSEVKRLLGSLLFGRQSVRLSCGTAITERL